MASFGATLKLRLDKGDVDRGLDRVVDTAQKAGAKLDGAMGRARKGASRFGRFLGSQLQPALFRLGDMAMDSLVKGFKIMAENSETITAAAKGWEKIHQGIFSGIGKGIDEGGGAGTVARFTDEYAKQAETTYRTIFGGLAKFITGEFSEGAGQVGRGAASGSPLAFGRQAMNDRLRAEYERQDKRAEELKKTADRQLQVLEEMNGKLGDKEP